MEYQDNYAKFFKLNQDRKEYILSISIYEAQNELIKAIEKQKVGLELGNNLLNVLFYLIIGTDNIILKLPLAKRDKAYNRINFPEEQEPFTGDIHLKNKGNYPEDENRIINIEKCNQDLKESQNGLIDDLQNLLDITEKLKKETSFLYEENAKLNTRLRKIQKENFERNLEVSNLKEEEQLLNDENIKLRNYNTDLEKQLNQKKENLQKNLLENKQRKLRNDEVDLGNGPKAISSRFENAKVKTFIPRITAKPKVEAYEESISIMRNNPFYYTDKRRSNFLNSNYPTEERFNRTDINIDINNQRKSFKSNYNEFISNNNSNNKIINYPDDNYKKKAKKEKEKLPVYERISERTNDYEDESKQILVKNNNVFSPREDSKSNYSESFNNDNIRDTDEVPYKYNKIEIEELSNSNDKYMNSDIVKSPMEESMLLNKLGKQGKNIKLKLLYKATIDSDKAEIFHKKCDKAKTSLIIIETINGMRFGGYTTQSWEGDGIDKKDDNAFVFSLDKLQIYNIISGQPAIGCYPKYGPVFLGCQIKVNDNFFVKGGTTYRRNANYAINSDFELNDGIKFFGIKDLEVFEVTLI